MPVHNADVAGIFEKMADLLDIQGANAFRVRAYRNAARSVGELPRSVASMVEDGADLTKLPGIGKDLAQKIEEIVETGTLSDLETLEGKVPESLATLLDIEGLGPKRVHAIHDALGITTLEELKAAAEAGRLRELEGFGAKTEEKILKEIETRGAEERRFKRPIAEQMAEPLRGYLADVKGVKQVTVAGSYRRCKDTVGDLDILVACTKKSPVMDRFVAYEDVAEVRSHGSTRSTVILKSGLQVDLRVLPQVSYGAALHYFTGSKAHNIAVRQRGVDRGYKVNEYGVFKGDERIAGKTEEEVYAAVDLPYIEPVLRENRGEIEAAETEKLPTLVELADIRGNLHTHSKASDGKYTIREMAEAAKERGYEYLAITDHSQAVRVANGLDAKRLAKQIEEIDRLNDELEGIRVLKSIEVDIMEDGSLDLGDDILKELDLAVASVHSHFNLSGDKQTERVLRAMDNRHFTIFGHPTGRLMGERPAYDIDLERIIEAAAERGCILEVNAQPDRLDLDDVHCKMAKEAGVKVSIATDAHSVTQLDLMRYGVDQARRGWLEAGDVVNTRPWTDLKTLLRR